LPAHSIQTGKFVDEIRKEYIAILKDIRDHCFTLTSIYPDGLQHYWLIPANPKYYDIMNAFKTTDTIIWKQSTKIQIGDIVFIYVGAPVSAIIFACRVLEINIPYQYKSKNLKMTHVMIIQKLKQYPENQFNFKNLKEYGVKAICRPRHVPEKLLKTLTTI
jgi:hypothetical protein